MAFNFMFVWDSRVCRTIPPSPLSLSLGVLCIFSWTLYFLLCPILIVLTYYVIFILLLSLRCLCDFKERQNDGKELRRGIEGRDIFNKKV